MPRNQLVPISRGALVTTRAERALIKHAITMQQQAMAVRAEDAARRYVAAGRLQDIGDLTEDALEAGGEIAARLESEAQARPFFARELADIAATGARGLKTELAYFIEEGH
ncbi:MAG TPA: hypothetical protein VIH71_08090 [Solirubrobacteraceae bacterium]